MKRAPTDLSSALYRWFRVGFATIFMVGIFLVSGRAIVIGILALIEKLRPDHAVIADPPPDVTVLIPAHNEENVIVQTVTSVLATITKNLQIIVVDDGSTDRTGELLDEHFGSGSTRAYHSSGESRQIRGAQPGDVAGAHQNCGDHRCRYRNRARRHLQIVAAFFRSAHRRGGGQRESWQSHPLAYAMASFGIHHQPEHGEARVRSC